MNEEFYIWFAKQRGENKNMSADDYQHGGDHYKRMGIQPWDVMEAVLTPEEFAGYLKGCIIKHSMRNNSKAGESKDIEKAKHYMAKLQEFYEYL